MVMAKNGSGPKSIRWTRRENGANLIDKGSNYHCTTVHNSFSMYFKQEHESQGINNGSW